MASSSWADLAKTAAEGNKPVPANEYNVFVEKAVAKSASTGKKMFAVTFKIMDGEYKGKPIWNNFTVSPENPNALAYFFSHMEALGLDQAFFAGDPSDEQIAAALAGAKAVLEVKVEHRAGRERNNVASVKAPPGGPAKAENVATAAPKPSSTPDPF